MKRIITIIAVVLGAFSVSAQNALNFPDTDDYGTVPNSLAFEFTDIFTFEAWIKVNGSGYQTVISTDSLTPSGHLGFWFGVTPTGVAGIQIFHGTFSWTTLEGTTNVNDNQWHHIAVGTDGTTVYIVVDGVQEGTEVYTAPVYGGSGHKLDIGVDQEGNNLTGTIDDLRLWWRAIPVSEINLYKDSCLTGLEDSLVALYKFDETVGSTFADASISGLNGTLTNMTDNDWVDGIVCVTPPVYTVSALEFDNTDDYVEIDTLQEDVFDFTGNFTIESWVKANAVSGLSSMVSKANAADTEGYFFGLVNGLVTLQTRDGAAVLFTSGTTNIQDTNCHHVAAVFNSGTIEIYVDGLLETSATGAPQPGPGATPLWIGRDAVSGDSFNGSISQVRIWNDARTASEILLYKDSTFVGSSDASLVAFYEFDGSAGQTMLFDQRASGTIHGTLMNMDVNTAWVIDSCVISPESTVGLYDQIQLEDLNVTVYPNPTEGKVHVKLNDATDVSIQVYSIDGKLVYSATNINSSIHEFELQNKAGMYQMIVISNGKQERIKLIKM